MKLSNLTFYDLKQFYTQAKNYALNISEMEAKVREATNDDPWGASSTLMQEIAQAHDFNEIMPTIFRRFMEKDAHEWRQIYKLLEYLVKNGSERVVDEARAHLSTIKILRSFHHIDDQGKDQGINIRNRAKELSALLSDVEQIRTERRKARANRAKYQGTGSTDFVPGSGAGRYGGFSSDAYYAGAGMSAAPSASRDAQDTYDEYDAGADETRVAASHAAPAKAAKSAPPVADLFSFDDDDAPPAPAAQPQATTAAKPAPLADDDFDDFQSADAPAPSAQPSAPPAAQPSAKSQGALFDLLDAPTSTSSAAPSFPPAPRSGAPPSQTPAPSAKPAAPPAPKPAASLFDDLWAESRGSTSSTASGPKSMAQLAKDQSSASMWNGPAQSHAAPSASAAKPPSGASKDLFDLL